MSIDSGRDFVCTRETSVTLRTVGFKNGVMTMNDDEMKCFENHAQDARYTDMGDCAPTCHAQMGTGGNNVPLVVNGQKNEDVETLRMREGCAGGGKGPLISKGVSLTLAVANDQALFEKHDAEGFTDSGHGDYWKGDEASGTIRAEGENRPSRPSNVVCVHGTQDPIHNPGDNANAIGRNNGAETCVFQQNQREEVRNMGDASGAINAEPGMHNQNFVASVHLGGCLNPHDPQTSRIFAAEGAFHTLNANSGGGMSREGVCVSPTITASNDPSRSPQSSEVTKQIEAVVLATIDGDKVNKKERKGGSGLGIGDGDVSYTSTAKDVHGVATRGADGLTVRRLLPIETERLMGFPDFWTRIPWKGKPAEECPDSPRYKACGNSFCVNCIEWIGRRIQMEEEKIQCGK